MSLISENTPLFDDGNIQTQPLLGSSEKTSTYSSFVGFAISLNYVIGTGVFGLPFAFYSGGIGLTTISLLFFTTFLSLTAFWTLEIMSRATGAIVAKENNSITAESKMTYVYGAMWAYAAAFASTAAMFVFEFFVSGQSCDIYNDPSSACHWSYIGFVLLFCCIVLPLTLMELSEQKALQVALTSYRFIAFGIMIITVIVAYAMNGPYEPNSLDSDWSSSFSSSFSQQQDSTFWGFKFSGFTVMFTSTAFALTVHYNLPNSLSPVRDKTHLKRVVLLVILVAVCFYWLVGAICAMFFREYTNPLVVLNWQGYTGRDGGWGEGKTTVIAYIVELAILLFPIINLTNDFPLVAITLSSNLDRFIPERFNENPKKKKITRIVVRLLVVFPPIIAAILVGKLDTILTFTGVFAFILVFIIPCVFQIISKKYMIEHYGPGSEVTPYSSVLSNNKLVYVVLAIGVIAFVYALVSAFLQALNINITL